MNTTAIAYKMLTVVAGLILVGCASPSPKDVRQIPPVQSNPLLRADLSPRRLTGREQVSLSATRTLFADRVTQLADGTVEASGRIYVDGGERSDDHFLGFPRYLYASAARWSSSTRVLELRGWPILEYRRGRIVATSADTTATIFGESINVEGPNAIKPD